jgi:hypothetical protein
MSAFQETLAEALTEALAVVRESKITIFTIAFYHDHESRAISVCVDTEENSHLVAASSNRYFSKYFWRALEVGDLGELRSSNANVGRSFSLGDFKLVNAGRRDLPKGKIPKDLYLDMIRVLRSKEEEIVALSVSRERLIFCCSGPNAEVDFWWCAAMPEEKK